MNSPTIKDTEAVVKKFLQGKHKAQVNWWILPSFQEINKYPNFTQNLPDHRKKKKYYIILWGKYNIAGTKLG